MDRRQLTYFIAVAESGSFTGAARSLHVAQPSLSHAIAALETDLGIRLFDRLGRGVRLTPAGQALVLPARQTLRSFDLARGAVRSVGDVHAGNLRVSTGTPWAMDPLPRIIGAFRQLHPAVNITLEDYEDRDQVFRELRVGEIHFGIVQGEPPAGALTSQLLTSQSLVAVLPPRALPHAGLVDADQLLRVGLICTSPGTALHDLTSEFLGFAPDQQIRVLTDHLAAVIPMVLAGAGAVLLPDRLADQAAARGARVVALRQPTRVEVHLVWRRRGLPMLAEQFRTLATTIVRDGATLPE